MNQEGEEDEDEGDGRTPESKRRRPAVDACAPTGPINNGTTLANDVGTANQIGQEKKSIKPAH